MFSQKKAFLIFPFMKLCIFHRKLKKKNPSRKKFLTFQEIGTSSSNIKIFQGTEALKLGMNGTF